MTKKTKYIARFVSFYYDEWDATCCDIHDIKVSASNPGHAFSIAKKRAEKIRQHYSPGPTNNFISLISEFNEIYIFSDGYLVALSKEDYKEIPNSFCSNSETYFIIDVDGDNEPRMVLR